MHYYMIEAKFNQFYEVVSAYDGFSDTEMAVHFWTMDLDEVPIEYFSDKCIFNVTTVAPMVKINNCFDLEHTIQTLILEYSDINSKEYPSIPKHEFVYSSKMAGFIACHQYSNQFSIIPIIELSGQDAEVMISAIKLVS